jgi:hypothetical protein
MSRNSGNDLVATVVGELDTQIEKWEQSMYPKYTLFNIVKISFKVNRNWLTASLFVKLGLNLGPIKLACISGSC